MRTQLFVMALWVSEDFLDLRAIFPQVTKFRLLSQQRFSQETQYFQSARIPFQVFTRVLWPTTYPLFENGVPNYHPRAFFDVSQNIQYNNK